MEEKLHPTVCRLCLSHNSGKNMVSLIDENAEDNLSCYGKAVLTFADVSIKKTDCLPSFMCQKCLILLKQAIFFKLQCESSYKKLKQLVKSHGSEQASEDYIESKVMDYTMFMHYFKQEMTEEYSYFHNSLKGKHKTLSCREDSITLDDTSICSEEPSTHDLEIPATSQSDNNTDDLSVNETELLDRLDQLIGTDKPMGSIKFKKRLKNKHIRHLKLQAKRRLASRSKIDHKDTDLVCHICQKVLANRYTYENHMQRHNGCRYICEQCGKGFPVSTELQTHLVSLHGSGPSLQCSHCTFKTARRFDLMEHERIHTGERPYTCDKCGLTFRRRGIWKKHLIYHMEKTVQCQQCPRKFYQRSEMLAHMNNVHERLYVYLCTKCGATYAKTATVRRHLAERHGIPKEAQGKVIRINKAKDTGLDWK